MVIVKTDEITPTYTQSQPPPSLHVLHKDLKHENADLGIMFLLFQNQKLSPLAPIL
jgi:hypothetical protein